MNTVLIVDDHAIVREGVKKALIVRGFTSIVEAASVAEARAQIALSNPEIVIVDINLPDGSGFELVRWIRSVSKEVAIVVLSFHDDANHVLAAMKAGASAFVCKSEEISHLVAAIEHSRIAPLTFSAYGLAGAIAQGSTSKDLTPREFDLLSLLEKGMTTKEIALRLFISQATVKTHLASIYRKLEVSNRTAAVHAVRKNTLPS